MRAPGAPANEPADAAVSWCLRVSGAALTVEEQRAFQAWLHEDPAHQARFDEAVAVWQAAEDQALTPDMITLRAAALEGLRQANRRRWTREPRIRAFAAAAAAVLVIGAVGWGWWTPDVYATGIGERQVVALADGSKVSLDADTRVRVRYRGDRRELWLERGRASFTVARDALRPFSVAAGDRTVVATGTKFSVERLAREVRVVLFEGKVDVLGARPSRSAAPPPVRIRSTGAPVAAALKPGGELVIPADSATAVLAPADLGRSLAWEGGELVFNDEPLARALERVNRYAERPIVLADAPAGQVRISGVFNAGDTTAFVEGVTATFPLRARSGADGISLSYENLSGR